MIALAIKAIEEELKRARHELERFGHDNPEYLEGVVSGIENALEAVRDKELKQALDEAQKGNS